MNTHVCNYRVCFSKFSQIWFEPKMFRDEWTILIDWIVICTHRIFHWEHFRLEEMLIVSVHHTISLILSTLYNVHGCVCLWVMNYFKLSALFSPKPSNYLRILFDDCLFYLKPAKTKKNEQYTLIPSKIPQISCVWSSNLMRYKGTWIKLTPLSHQRADFQVLKCVCDRKCARSSLAWAFFVFFFSFQIGIILMPLENESAKRRFRSVRQNLILTCIILSWNIIIAPLLLSITDETVCICECVTSVGWAAKLWWR